MAKDAKDWTLDEQKAVAEDIAAKGEASPAYAKAKVAMDAGTKFSVKLTNGKTMEYRIVGINHDDFADGSGKAGLTFEAANDALDQQRMNATKTSVGGWEKSDLRDRLNTGDLWALLPSELQSKVKSVTKMTDNQVGGTPSATTDKVFLLSATEVYGNFWSNGHLQSDGSQYEYYASKGVTLRNYSVAASGYSCWTRSASTGYSMSFHYVQWNGDCAASEASGTLWLFPAWCF